MKKYFVCALAALSFTACVNEDGLLSETKGYINLNVNAEENVSVTRAEVPITAEDWFVVVNSDAAITVKELAGKAYVAKEENTLTAYNYATMDDALTANSGRGAAYWTGTSGTFAIRAGETADVIVECGKAQNAAFAAVFNETFTTVASGYKLTAKSGSRSLDFDATNTSDGYFVPGTITYTIAATVNGKSVNVSKDLTLTAGTKTTLTVKANTNGTISLSITYDNMTSESKGITIDAATGEEVPETPVTE